MDKGCFTHRRHHTESNVAVAKYRWAKIFMRDTGTTARQSIVSISLWVDMAFPTQRRRPWMKNPMIRLHIFGSHNCTTIAPVKQSAHCDGTCPARPGFYRMSRYRWTLANCDRPGPAPEDSAHAAPAVAPRADRGRAGRSGRLSI
ncbi:hypothetical protein J6590_064210 [Homalodisca vitripennis]|nr:hypothetical protein J6590_064210 [Homalodisca vitripennis]